MVIADLGHAFWKPPPQNQSPSSCLDSVTFLRVINVYGAGQMLAECPNQRGPTAQGPELILPMLEIQ